jgi:voltage-gated potassium channel Kch
MTKFLREPPSVRTAASVIVTATAVVVVASGVAMRLIDHSQYKTVWVGMWWALQTVTTVGYGDVTPSKAGGRILASFVMFEGIAFLAITTAVVTASFVARAEKELDPADTDTAGFDFDRLERRFDELAERLERVETVVNDLRDHR